MAHPFISVCIPTYRRADLLPRLLDSVAEQSFRDFDVVITDNTEAGDDAVEAVATAYQNRLPLSYHRNPPGLSMGENWNRCYALAGGEWLKMIHDDDWLTGPDSLASFAEAARAGNARFLFSSFEIVNTAKNERHVQHPASKHLRRLAENPLYLAQANVVGPPSTTLLHRSAVAPFKALKWMVDVEGYIRMMQQGGGAFRWIEQPLVCIQAHAGQATHAYFRKPEVEIPENLTLLHAQYPAILKYYWSYDHYWRLLRNTGIRAKEQLERYADGQAIPEAWLRMLAVQRRIPASLLKNGALSKLLMTASFLANRK